MRFWDRNFDKILVTFIISGVIVVVLELAGNTKIDNSVLPFLENIATTLVGALLGIIVPKIITTPSKPKENGNSGAESKPINGVSQEVH